MNGEMVGHVPDLGDSVRDRINGFRGVVIGKAQYLYGCRQVLVSPPKLAADGKVQDGQWLDEDRVAVVAIGVASKPASAAERAGGPLTGPAPRRR
jgi:hypothetical protein